MKHLLFTVLLLLSFSLAKANMACRWTSSKAGITINYIASCDLSSSSVADSILHIIVRQLNRQDTSLKILVLISYGELSFPGSEFSNFFSIGYDTLRGMDDTYIFDYYWNQQTIAADKNSGLNTFRSEDMPLDINATYDKKAPKEVGIKIIYDIDYRLGEIVWSDLEKAVSFAARNLDFIRKEQRRDTVRYNTNGWYVSLPTIDTFAINKIIGKQSEREQQVVVPDKTTTKNKYWLFGLLGLVAIGIVVFRFRQR